MATIPMLRRGTSPKVGEPRPLDGQPSHIFLRAGQSEARGA